MSNDPAQGYPKMDGGSFASFDNEAPQIIQEGGSPEKTSLAKKKAHEE
jgi:hypothetical protein